MLSGLCYEVEGIQGQKSFAGSVEVLTDASTIVSREGPRFRHVQLKPADQLLSQACVTILNSIFLNTYLVSVPKSKSG